MQKYLLFVYLFLHLQSCFAIFHICFIFSLISNFVVRVGQKMMQLYGWILNIGLNKECNIFGHKWTMTHNVLKFCKYKISNPCLACWAFFRLIVSAICNYGLCHQNHCGDKREVLWVFLIYCALPSSYFCESLALYVLWIAYDQIYYGPSLAYWVHFWFINACNV